MKYINYFYKNRTFKLDKMAINVPIVIFSNNIHIKVQSELELFNGENMLFVASLIYFDNSNSHNDNRIE